LGDYIGKLVCGVIYDKHVFCLYVYFCAYDALQLRDHPYVCKQKKIVYTPTVKDADSTTISTFLAYAYLFVALSKVSYIISVQYVASKVIARKFGRMYYFD